MNKNLLFLLLFSCFQSGWAEQAEPRWYKVEIVAFSYLSKIAMAQERWPAQPEPLDLSKAVELTAGNAKASIGQPISGGKPPVAFQMLADSELELKADANAISRSKGRHLLLHTAWLQPAFDRQQSTAVHLRGNERFTPLPVPGTEFTRVEFQPGADSVPSYQLSTENNLEPALAVAPAQQHDSAEAPQIYLRIPDNSGQKTSPQLHTGVTNGVQVPEQIEVNILDSSFTVSIGRYLHVWVDMIYREPVAISPAMDGDDQEFILPAYGIKMHRRMRSNELHYIDHPKVSMLVKITRYELPESSPESDLQNTDLPIATDVVPAQ